jgi:gliding motility-associated-like protein
MFFTSVFDGTSIYLYKMKVVFCPKNPDFRSKYAIMDTHKLPYRRWGLLLLAILVISLPNFGQTPFLRTGQVFQILENTNELQVFSVQPSYNSLNAQTLGTLPAGGLEALAFRRTDNFLYAIGKANNHLYKIGQNAEALDLGHIGLDNTLFYLAGDIGSDGRYFYSVGSDALGMDVHLAKIDLETPGFPTQFVPLNGSGRLADIAIDPIQGTFYGYDQLSANILIINPASGVSSPLHMMAPGNTLYGLYFDAFTDLYGVGQTLNGVVDGFYKIDKATGKEKRLATGPTTTAADMASCPYSVEIKNDVEPRTNLPCTDLIYSCTLVNLTEDALDSVEFLLKLPPGFQVIGVLQNTYGSVIDTSSIPGTVRMLLSSLPPGFHFLKIKMSVGDIPKGNYKTQALVQNLPLLYDLVSRSDFPGEVGFEDSTAFRVNRFDQDSLDFAWLICRGESLVLETTQYGDNILWNNGSTTTNRTVQQGGLYSFTAGSTCEKLVVNHEVTSATCPFTISIEEVFQPDTLFACSDVLFRFIIRNDSGEPRANLSVIDSLPPGFTFVEVLKNPFGGAVKPNLPAQLFCIEGLNLKVGVDTLDIKVHVGDVAPGSYKNRAILSGLPILMGPIRLSDNPFTFQQDSSVLVIQGALSDTIMLQDTLCKNATLTLDASNWGKTFLWDNGQTTATRTITEPGLYQITLFDGCEPAQVYWEVSEGTAINITPIGPFQIHQGESIVLNPGIWNAGQSLDIYWYDPLSSSLSCTDCVPVTGSPLQSTVYGIKVANETCSDSTSILVEVDESRRIYTPNVFSPNDDGENDAFFFQSPDFGLIKVFSVFDRWGNLMVQSTNRTLDDQKLWDGTSRNKAVPAGVYVWRAIIEFIDGREEAFTGNVTLVR